MAYKYDKQRQKMIYPFVGYSKKPILSEELDVTIDKGSISFTSSDSESETFTEASTSVPKVTPVPVGSDDTVNVNLYITSVSTSGFTVEASAPFTGTVDWIAVGD